MVCRRHFSVIGVLIRLCMWYVTTPSVFVLVLVLAIAIAAGCCYWTQVSLFWSSPCWSSKKGCVSPYRVSLQFSLSPFFAVLDLLKHQTFQPSCPNKSLRPALEIDDTLQKRGKKKDKSMSLESYPHSEPLHHRTILCSTANGYQQNKRPSPSPILLTYLSPTICYSKTLNRYLIIGGVIFLFFLFSSSTHVPAHASTPARPPILLNPELGLKDMSSTSCPHPR